MKKYLLGYLILCMIACDQKEQRQKQEDVDSYQKGVDTTTNYPDQIIDKHLEYLYDKSKWLIYCIHCDERCRFYKKLNIVDTPFFGSLELRFNNVSFLNDTAEFNFNFYYKDTLKCDVNTVYNYGTLTYGAAFRNHNDSVIYFLSETTMRRFSEKGKTSRYDNPLQPEVINFIRSNKDKLNSWFREEAKRRRVLQ